MIKTAKVINPESRPDEVGIFDTVEYYVEEDDAVEKVRIVTALRQNSLEKGLSVGFPPGQGTYGQKDGRPRLC